MIALQAASLQKGQLLPEMAQIFNVYMCVGICMYLCVRVHVCMLVVRAVPAIRGNLALEQLLQSTVHLLSKIELLVVGGQCCSFIYRLHVQELMLYAVHTSTRMLKPVLTLLEDELNVYPHDGICGFLFQACVNLQYKRTMITLCSLGSFQQLKS